MALRRTIALLLIPAITTSCHSWRTAEVEPRALVESEHPRDVRVTTQDNTRYVLRGPRIVEDTLRGLRGNDSVAVALRDVSRVEVQRSSPLKTVAVILGVGVVGMGALIWYGFCIGDGRSGCNVGS
jgi:hypothetical protein